jgi:hypothetical protein
MPTGHCPPRTKNGSQPCRVEKLDSSFAGGQGWTRPKLRPTPHAPRPTPAGVSDPHSHSPPNLSLSHSPLSLGTASSRASPPPVVASRAPPPPVVACRAPAPLVFASRASPPRRIHLISFDFVRFRSIYHRRDQDLRHRRDQECCRAPWLAARPSAPPTWPRWLAASTPNRTGPDRRRRGQAR